jgi:hypothetical protein
MAEPMPAAAAAAAAAAGAQSKPGVGGPAAAPGEAAGPLTRLRKLVSFAGLTVELFEDVKEVRESSFTGPLFPECMSQACSPCWSTWDSPAGRPTHCMRTLPIGAVPDVCVHGATKTGAGSRGARRV